MAKVEKLSFGIELEFYIAWRAAAFNGTVPTPPGPRSGPGAGPLVIRARRPKGNDIIYTLASIIDEAFPSPAGTVASSGGGGSGNGEGLGRLMHYQRWAVEPDSTLDTLPQELEDQTNQYFGWAGVELVSPALWATQEAFEEVRKVCEFLQKRFWMVSDPQAGFHIHVGSGSAWPPLNSLRQIAALIYAADPILAQSHPPHRRNNIWCTSIRLYSNLSFGLRRLSTEDRPIPGRLEDEEERPVYATGYTRIAELPQNPFRHILSNTKPASNGLDRSKNQFPPRPSESVYHIDNEVARIIRLSHGPFIKEAQQTSAYEPIPMMTAVAQILQSPNMGAIAGLLGVGERRGAYNFWQLDRDVKRTIEFRQAASTVDPVEVIAYTRIAIRLFEFGASASPEELLKVILDCEMAEEEPAWFDLYDLLHELDLLPEAKIVQAVLSGNMTHAIRKEYWLSRGHRVG
ncbi:putative amidoligase enzyme-domain-containing protein [Daldinia sp. FL1419]|nr:putative amidoligase enzyme-domain-containing protein [Daldinia sp. FL1419]